MKLLFAGTFAFISQLTFIPAYNIVLVLCLAIGMDFLTGCRKSSKNGVEIRSRSLRKTQEKIKEYLFTIVLSSIICYISELKGGEAVKLIAGFLNNSLIFLFIYFELVSILENLIEANPESPLAQNVWIPLHKFFTFQIRNNPLKKQADALKTQDPTTDPFQS